MQAKEDIDEDKRNREIRVNREKLRDCFNDAANALINHYNNAMNGLLNEFYRNRIREIDNKIMDIRTLRKNKSDACNLLKTTQNECRQLISDIHRDSISQEA